MNENYSYETFTTIRERYEQQCQDSSNHFDSNIIGLSASWLWAWAWFLTQFQFNNIYLLIISWVFLIFAIWITLYSYKISESTIRKVIEKLDLEYNKWKQKEISDIEKEINKKTGILICMNKSSIWFLIWWIVFLGLFLFTNIIKMDKKTNDDSQKSTQQMIERQWWQTHGYVPQKPQPKPQEEPKNPKEENNE
jgi:uncharacterized ion transporter superfamily protein YfcC